MKGKQALPFLDKEALGTRYVEELVFEATLQQKEELKECCTRMDEVRLYTMML